MPVHTLLSTSVTQNLSKTSKPEFNNNNNNNNNNNDFISKALFHVKHAQLRCTMPMNNTHTHIHTCARARQKHLTKEQ